jgi:hypothetical protein
MWVIQVKVAVGGAVEEVEAKVGIARPKPQLSPVRSPNAP